MPEVLQFYCEYAAARNELSALLGECREAALACFAHGREEMRLLREGAGNDDIWFAWNNMAAELIQASLAIADRFLGPPKIMHRFTIERIGADGSRNTREFTRDQVLPFPRLPRVRGRPPKPVVPLPALENRRTVRGAPRGNTNALKYPRLRQCRETCRRYRLLIRRILAAVTLHDVLASQLRTDNAIPVVPQTRRRRRTRRSIPPVRRTRLRAAPPPRQFNRLSPRATGPPRHGRARMSPVGAKSRSGNGRTCARCCELRSLTL